MKTLRLVLAAGVMGLSAPGALADDAFGERSLHGAYGFSGSGTILLPATAGGPVPAAALGIMTFDGAGGCEIRDTINVGGNAASRTSLACDYAIDSDGSGTITAYFDGDPGPVPLSLVLVRGGKAFHWIRTDIGVANGTAERQGSPRHHD